MKPLRSLIPIGTATLLPHTAQSVRRLEDQLLAHCSTWGYQEIILPSFEYLDVLAVGLAPEILEKCYKIFRGQEESCEECPFSPGDRTQTAFSFWNEKFQRTLTGKSFSVQWDENIAAWLVFADK